MFSTHRHPTAFANHVFPPSAKQTNGHLGARPTQIENATKFNKQQAIRQTLRVEFTLTKLQEEYPEKKTESETNYSGSQNYKSTKGTTK